MPYITQFNALRMLRSIENVGIETGEIYEKPIYVFNNLEVQQLLRARALFEDVEFLDGKMFNPIVTKDKLLYVFEGSKPRYHSNLECKRLALDFQNFEIPEEIKEKGLQEINRFRLWFKENKELLEKPDVFDMRLSAAFGLRHKIKHVNYDNSGYTEVENLDLYQVKNSIEDLLNEIDEYYRNSSDRKKKVIYKYRKRTYLAYKSEPIPDNDTGYADETIKEFLKKYDQKFKVPLRKLLINYYRARFNQNLKFEGYLLEQLGFLPCLTCYSDVGK